MSNDDEYITVLEVAPSLVPTNSSSKDATDMSNSTLPPPPPSDANHVAPGKHVAWAWFAVVALLFILKQRIPDAGRRRREELIRRYEAREDPEKRKTVVKSSLITKVSVCGVL